MKRALIITASIIFLIGIGVGVYFKFFTKAPPFLSTSNTFEGSPNTDPSSTPANKPITSVTEVAPHLIKITDGPVAFGTLVLTTKETRVATGTPETPSDILIRYIERASGNIYNYQVGTRALTRISNKTLPGITEASWIPDGSRAYVRFLTKEVPPLEHIATYELSSSGEEGRFLEQDLSQVSVVGSSTVFSLFSGTTGSVGSLSSIQGTQSKTLFTSLLSSLVVHPTSAKYFASTKPSLYVGGYGFEIDSKTGVFTRLLGPLRGLSILPNKTGSSILFSYVTEGVLNLNVIDVASRGVTALPLSTLAEKCTWSKDGLSVYCGVPTNLSGALPDAWYQGAVSFSDRLWKIDMTAREASLIVDPFEVGKVSIDAVSLAVDNNETTLFFTDLHTGSLWSYTP
jgi:hypothetical protein